MDLKGSQTEKNLISAFSGESIARNKYTYFSSQAKKDGYVQISKIFEETANNEKEHAKIWFKLLNGGEIKKTIENLKIAIESENYEWTTMYPEFARVAKKEGFNKISKLFEEVSKIEKMHHDRYKKILKELENNAIFEKSSEIVWECSNCGHLHKGFKAPLICPVCNHPQAYFLEKSDNY